MQLLKYPEPSLSLHEFDVKFSLSLSMQKLQFAKAEAQKEIAALKSKVSELERKLSLQQMSAAKRKRF